MEIVGVEIMAIQMMGIMVIMEVKILGIQFVGIIMQTGVKQENRLLIGEKFSFRVIVSFLVQYLVHHATK